MVKIAQITLGQILHTDSNRPLATTDNGNGTYNLNVQQIGSIDSKKESIGAVVENDFAYDRHNFTLDGKLSGSALAQETKSTIVDISGAGKIIKMQAGFLNSDLDNINNYNLIITLKTDDNIIITGDGENNRDTPNAAPIIKLYKALNSGDKWGIVRCDKSISQNYTYFTWDLSVFSSFQNSLFAEIENKSASQDVVCGVGIWYSILASESVTLVGSEYKSSTIRNVMKENKNYYTVTKIKNYIDDESYNWKYKVYWRTNESPKDILKIIQENFDLEVPQ